MIIFFNVNENFLSFFHQWKKCWIADHIYHYYDDKYITYAHTFFIIKIGYIFVVVDFPQSTINDQNDLFGRHVYLIPIYVIVYCMYFVVCLCVCHYLFSM